MQSAAAYEAGLVTMWIKLSTLGYCQKTLRQLLGKQACADHPFCETSPLTNGPLAWMMWGPQNTKYTPPQVLKALGQAIARTFGPWVASSKLVRKEVHMYVDAAKWMSTYLVGVWADDAGARLWETPPTVRSQQADELLGVQKTVKMAAYRGMKELKRQGHNGAQDSTDIALEWGCTAADIRAFEMAPGGLKLQNF